MMVKLADFFSADARLFFKGTPPRRRDTFFGSLGEIRERTYEERLNTASSLNLLLAAIVAWNAVHIQACVRKLRSDGEQINDEDLRYLSPLLRHHIGSYGQYNFDFRRFEAPLAAESVAY